MKFIFSRQRAVNTVIRAFTTSTRVMTSELALRKGEACPPYKPGTLRLYSMRFCPYAQRTRLVLIHKGIEHETVNVNLRYKPQWLFDMNPIGLVPILQWDNNKVIYESATCNDYLDEMYPQHKLTPSDPYQKARDRQLWESMGKLIDTFYAVGGTGGQDQKVMDRLFRAYTRYEKELISRGAGPYFGGVKIRKSWTDYSGPTPPCPIVTGGCGFRNAESVVYNAGLWCKTEAGHHQGDKPCMVDFMLWPWFERLPVINVMVPETTITSSNYPTLAAWIKTMYELPAVKETMFGVDAHAHFLKSLRVDKKPDYDYGLVGAARL